MTPSRKIILLVEGGSEEAFAHHLKEFLDRRCREERRPQVRIRAIPMDSDLLHPGRLGKAILRLLAESGVLGVISLVDVLCSGHPSHFGSAEEAITYLRSCGPLKDSRYRAHAAQYELEAWLLPYWDDICRRVGARKRPPGKNPETVNRNKPPSRRLADLYQSANPPRKYHKITSLKEILSGKDLLVSAAQCPQFKSFLNSLLDLSGCTTIP